VGTVAARLEHIGDFLREFLPELLLDACFFRHLVNGCISNHLHGVKGNREIIDLLGHIFVPLDRPFQGLQIDTGIVLLDLSRNPVNVLCIPEPGVPLARRVEILAVLDRFFRFGVRLGINHANMVVALPDVRPVILNLAHLVPVFLDKIGVKLLDLLQPLIGLKERPVQGLPGIHVGGPDCIRDLLFLLQVIIERLVMLLVQLIDRDFDDFPLRPLDELPGPRLLEFRQLDHLLSVQLERKLVEFHLVLVGQIVEGFGILEIIVNDLRAVLVTPVLPFLESPDRCIVLPKPGRKPKRRRQLAKIGLPSEDYINS